MADLLEYKCPKCGGAITFNSNIQKMKCPSCETEYAVETLKTYDEQLKEEFHDHLDWESYNKQSGSGDWRQGETEHMRFYNCSSCGAEIVGDETLAATSCPYCGNPVVMKSQFAGILRPDFVIPFQLDKASAKEALRNHLKGKILLPKFFKEESRIDSITGIYVPFWLFNCDTDASIRYKATRVLTWSDPNFIHTKTDHFLVLREGALSFEKVPVDGSEKMDDAYMEAIEPFDYSKMVDFQTAYLAGFLANKYDQDANESVPRANERIKESVVSAFASSVQGYVSCVPEATKIQLKQGEIRYALFPVWMLTTTYKGKPYTFAMNGQTGKFVGELPMDRKRFWGFFFTFFASIAALGTALLFLL